MGLPAESIQNISSAAGNMNLQYLQMIQIQNFVRNLLNQQSQNLTNVANQGLLGQSSDLSSSLNRSEISSPSSSGIGILKQESSIQNSSVTPYDTTRPSVYNRRISSEQTTLSDGRICTRVPARRWAKVSHKVRNSKFQYEISPEI